MTNRVHGWSLVKASILRILQQGRKRGILSRNNARKTDSDAHSSNSNLDLRCRHDESLLYSAIPFLPLPAATTCCVLNFIIPGLGTIISGFLAICIGCPRIHYRTDRIEATVFINCIVGICQIGTITFLLVGWCWSIAWGCLIMIHSIEYRNAVLASKKERLANQAFEAISHAPVRKQGVKDLYREQTGLQNTTLLALSRRQLNIVYSNSLLLQNIDLLEKVPRSLTNAKQQSKQEDLRRFYLHFYAEERFTENTDMSQLMWFR